MLNSAILCYPVYLRHSLNTFLQVNGLVKNLNLYAQMSSWTNLMFKCPSLELQQYVDVPILKQEMHCFNPTPESMKCALRMFVPRHDHKIKCVSRTNDSEKYPSHNMPEVAFLGQSNAGKSSLLKAIFNEAPELKKGILTSKKPGHTKCLSFYQVGNHFCLIDMPGYGMLQPKWFESSVVNYLKNRKNLLKTFMLIDCREGFNSWDDAALKMLKDLKLPFGIVLTKIDDVPVSQRLKTLLHVQNMIADREKNCFPQIFMLSAVTFEGLAYFLTFVAHITGNLDVKNT